MQLPVALLSCHAKRLKYDLHNFEQSSLLTLILKQIKIHWACKYMWHSYHFMQFWYKRFLNAPKGLGKILQTAKITQERSSSISLSTSLCGLRPKSKMKTIGHAITCRILIVSWNPNISYSMTCTETSLKGPKRQRILKIELFPG